jgi:hypothetical protein
MVTPGERSNASTCADFPAPAPLLSVVALESVASRAAEFKIGESLTTPFGANFKCGDHIGDCDPQSAQISLSKKGLPQGWARDLMRRDAQITSTGTKICFEANSYCQESRLVEVQIGA